MFKTPSFWYRTPDTPAPLTERALAHIAHLYQLGHRINCLRQSPKKVNIPVICVGNFTAGGAGKTPTALALCALLKSEGISNTPYFLTRGYGGSITTATHVNVQSHTYKDVGDEALLLATSAPTIVSPNRYEGAQKAQEMGADIIIMDDGFQNQTLHKDVNIIVVNGIMGFGNTKTIPAGPLRETLDTSLSRAHIALIIDEDTRNCTAYFKTQNIPVINADITPAPIDLNKKYIAFAGLGYPQKFFNTLKDMGANVLKTHVFPDHHPYSEYDIKMLAKEAEHAQATLITTTKDKTRLHSTQLAQNIETLAIKLKIKDKALLLKTIREAL